jgi:hypothetical protein
VSAERDAAPDAPTPPRRETIAFIARNGVTWWVTERDARGDPGCRGPRCLIFSNEEVVRRVWRYPPAWRTLSDGELEALGSDRATFSPPSTDPPQLRAG